MGLYSEKCGFGKRKKRVADIKKIKQDMVKLIVKRLKAEGKKVDRQAINQEVLDKVRRKHQTQQKRHG